MGSLSDKIITYLLHIVDIQLLIDQVQLVLYC